ncbi:rhodanese-like domain-containing protein [Methanosarcina sp. 1.H.A.2.2]|uniref:MBL fold metallo-hydrolase n=1 Tax=Methanosarcina sp. 1.H.A.2.2 TaxID=1483601 RepID=UPI00062153A1|nr:MBL fold metallo-hydrolase [Methanosarcina sp. 1.H.A.2.2]KKH45417.1 beta-lactamase [Methanosarcina sp. 1.H.A.2.2]
MQITPFFVRGIAHSSYILAGKQSCAVIDPQRDMDVYIKEAKSRGLKITHILETHLHADFVSGHMDLAELTGAPIYAPKAANCEFEHVGLIEGNTFEIEDTIVRILETPGHTPEHICYVVSDTSRGPDPAAVFCGDALFVGDVGRPDLFPGKARELASMLYDSLHKKLLSLPDSCEVYPAHGEGSLCGRAMGAKRSSTIGYERKYNYALRIPDREGFIENLTTNMPPAPDHFSRCTEVNRKGPTKLKEIPPLREIPPGEFFKFAGREDTAILDTRHYESFGGEHVPGSWCIDLRSNFATYAGWLLPPDKQILLVSDSEENARKSAVWLCRVGLDSIVGFLSGEMFAWVTAGLRAAHVPQLSIPELYEGVRSKNPPVILDVRVPSEYESFHIEHAVNIPVQELRERHMELDPEAEYAVICSTGHRSGMGCSILKKHGFSRVNNTAGGMTGYNAAGFGPECPMCAISWAGKAGRKEAEVFQKVKNI